MAQTGMEKKNLWRQGPALLIRNNSVKFHLKMETDFSLQNVILIKITTVDNVQGVCPVMKMYILKYKMSGPAENLKFEAHQIQYEFFHMPFLSDIMRITGCLACETYRKDCCPYENSVTAGSSGSLQTTS
jgi:hypothetical protein